MDAEPPAIAQECVEGYLFAGRPARVLLFRRPPARGGYWVPVSGKVDPTDADFRAALDRELAEETGFTRFVRVFPLDWEVTFPGANGGTWRLHAYGVELETEQSPRLSDEHDTFEWVAPEEAARRLHFTDNRDAILRLMEKVEGRSPPTPRPSSPDAAQTE